MRSQKQSSIYQTAPWGFESDNDFYNMVLSVNTALSANELLDLCKKIEAKAGRKSKASKGYESRPLDIDILFYDAIEISSPKLTVPHPKISQRKFVLAPLNEIAPDWMHPVMKKTIKELAEICSDNSAVKRLTT
jgi:2-amino-4-hydroxy-6-hydroxymethyldihydropteridine diphosphokinase